jgi:hypothetical protein
MRRSALFSNFHGAAARVQRVRPSASAWMRQANYCHIRPLPSRADGVFHLWAATDSPTDKVIRS